MKFVLRKNKTTQKVVGILTLKKKNLDANDNFWRGVWQYPAKFQL